MLKPYLLSNGEIDWDSINIDVYEGEMIQVYDLSEIPDGYNGYVVHINDHGNASLYLAFSNGDLNELWSRV